MKKKMGRPKLPKGEAKGFQIGVRFNKEEADEIKAAIAKTGLANSDWARSAMLSQAKISNKR